MLSGYIIGRLKYYFIITLALFNILFFIKAVVDLYPFLSIGVDNLWSVFLLILYSVPFINFNILPVSLLAATFLTVRQFSDSSEFVAMGAIGLPFRRIVYPVVKFTLVYVFIQAILGTYGMPYYLNKIEQSKSQLARKVFISKLKPETPNEINGAMIYFKAFTDEFGLKDAIIVNRGKTQLIQAKQMIVSDVVFNQKINLEFIHGTIFNIDMKSNRLNELTFDSLTFPMTFDVGIFDDMDIDADEPRKYETKFKTLLAKPLKLLLVNDVFYLINHSKISKKDRDLYVMFLYETAYFILIVLLFPLCIIPFAHYNPRSGGGKKSLWALLFVVANYMAFSTLSRWGQNGRIEPATLFVLPFFFLIVSLLLIYNIDYHFLAPAKTYMLKHTRRLNRGMLKKIRKNES